MPRHRSTRRKFTATAAGFAAGVFATSLHNVIAQDATPQATPAGIVPAGYVSTRLRTLSSADARDQVNERVLEQFAPEVEALTGFEGYVLGDVIDRDDQNLSIVVLEDASQQEAFDTIGQEFVASLGELGVSVDTTQWAGELLITGRPTSAEATPGANPNSSASQSYVAFRFHTSRPGTDPRDFVPLATSGFLPIVAGLGGFQGYLWYPTDEGFASISLFDSVESANESTEAAREWAAEYLAEYTDENPLVINADVVYANLPILR